MDKNGSVQNDSTRAARGKGVSGQSLPEATGQNNEESMAASLDGASMGNVMQGHTPMGSIAGDAKSDPWDTKPGMQNKGKDEIGAPPEKSGSTK